MNIAERFMNLYIPLIQRRKDQIVIKKLYRLEKLPKWNGVHYIDFASEEISRRDSAFSLFSTLQGPILKLWEWENIKFY